MNQIRYFAQVVSSIISDYRSHEIQPINTEHVLRWVSQFDGEAQESILQELSFVLTKNYYSRSKISDHFSNLLGWGGPDGTEPSIFWQTAQILDLYESGHSQRDLIDLFLPILANRYGEVGIERATTPSSFVYIDDFLLSGNRIGDDLEDWILRAAPQRAVLHVLLLGVTTSGLVRTKVRLAGAVRRSGKELRITWSWLSEFEDRWEEDRDLLTLSILPDEASVREYYLAVKESDPRFRLRPQEQLGRHHQFQSSSGRNILEQQFVTAGLQVISMLDSPPDYVRPLGFHGKASFGFGAILASYRNCPNHCPLALWWGDGSSDAQFPWNSWYPLLPRRESQQLEEAHGLQI